MQSSCLRARNTLPTSLRWSRSLWSRSSLRFSAISSRISRTNPRLAFTRSPFSDIFKNSFSSSPTRFITLNVQKDTLAAEKRFFSTNKSQSGDSEILPILPPKSVGLWLLASSTLVFAIIVVGGVTRLTESGLSITEWKPVAGILPPMSQVQWEEEFEKYRATPEFKLLNHSFQLEDFKRIFYMEWGHRVLGRLIGVAFVGPLVFFAVKKRISKPLANKLGGLALLIGAQGGLGWYMVKSGLDDALMETPGAVPRVSQYRLAAHLGLALLLYAGMFSSGLAIVKEWKYATGAQWMGLTTSAFNEALNSPAVMRFKARSWVLTGLIFLTALSGAFVAGLDAGLLYNEFPLMGGRLAPPKDELMSLAYAKRADGSDKWWRNVFENPTTVQFNHRVLAMTSYLGTTLLFLRARSMHAVLPPLTRTAVTAAFAVVNIQLLLGITTLLQLVPVPLAAAHQAGSVMVLSAMIHVLLTLRKPGAAARAWRALHMQRLTGGTKINKSTLQ
ncbi:cytochrome oxidase assembly protein-domain-containing protein [Lentinula edodes]|uniref:cytochrome oxidase assembly protein-domain-containing protein n=1 Tax=Lentinula edodes TaxID=5353 RepID=UPI001E8D8014|nr:cytochrome oxidase assembly protein-domain-containing protein [Lentinula edodes]KAH7868770.1 cytochrome oxidase assembly protein-domain-containing protein [Lentinula edodes]